MILSPPLCLMTKVILCVWDVIPVPYEFPPDMKIDGLFEIPLVPWTLLTSFLASTWINENIRKAGLGTVDGNQKSGKLTHQLR